MSELHTVSIPLSAVEMGERCRQDLGNIKALAESMSHLGLLNPITLDRQHRLLAGHRRLEAARSLGWDRIDARIALNATTLLDALEHERDENTCRKDFTPSEAASLAHLIVETIEGPEADRRRLNGNAVGGRGGGNQDEVVENFSATSRAKDRAAEHVGYSRPTLDKAEKVVKASEDESLPESVREVARQAREEMDRTGKVDPAHRKVREVMDGSRDDPDEVSRQKLGRKAAQLHDQYGSGLLALDPQRVAQTVEPEERIVWRATAEQSAKWWSDLLAALGEGQGLRVVEGGKS